MRGEAPFFLRSEQRFANFTPVKRDLSQGQSPHSLDGAIQRVDDTSKLIITWALSAIAGSIALVFGNVTGTSQLPFTSMVHFILAIGGIALMVSMHFGSTIQRRIIAYHISPLQNVKLEIFSEINREFDHQLNCFYSGIVTLAIWLSIFLLQILVGLKEIGVSAGVK